VSTFGEILKRNGLVKARRRSKRTPPYTQPFLECTRPNAVWSADYKGEFRLGDGKLCYPLTITDNFSRYVFACRGFQRIETMSTLGSFEKVFREHGLPDAIKTDNGAPFASRAVGGLSRLSVWFIKLGIWPERIAAGCPEQNGRHERMHLTLKDEVAMPPEKNLKEQQRSFDRFLYEFNHERPHEALEQKVPGEVYKSSHRRYPSRTLDAEYDGGTVVRRVRSNGEIKWRGGLVFVSTVLMGERIGLRQVDNDYWELFYSFYPLGILNEKTRKIEPYR
jgi:transposase InsO family protein